MEYDVLDWRGILVDMQTPANVETLAGNSSGLVTAAGSMTVAWHALPSEEVCVRLSVDPSVGLSAAQTAERLRLFGLNELREKRQTPAWLLFLHQFKSPIISVLLLAAAVALVLGEFKDSSIIFAVLTINALVGFVQEGRAARSMAALRKLSSPRAHVRRAGKVVVIPARELVPGDILILTSGDRIPADARVLEVAALITLEGALTGESTGVTKKTAVVKKDATLGDRKNMVFAGTVVASGRGEAIVVATGMRSELGKIATMVQEAVEPLSPLQLRLKSLGRLIIVTVLATMAAVFGLGLWRGLPVREMAMIAISQAVSAIPEGLPVAATVALAVGMQRMARRRAIIRKLAAVETLGSATVICSDKTGTLTKNEMSVTRLWTPSEAFEVTGIGYEPKGEFLGADGNPVDAGKHADLKPLLEVGALCNDAHLLPPGGGEGWRVDGDPTEAALVVAAEKAGIAVTALRHEQPREWEIPFDPTYRLMATAHRHGHLRSGLRVCVKGAPEEVLKLCHGQRRAGAARPLDAAGREVVFAAQRAMAGDGLRVLAYAEAELAPKDLRETFECLHGKLVFLGLIGQMDPPRPEAREAVEICRAAGIRTVMVTGDHLLTGKSVARLLGIAGQDSLACEGAAVTRMRAEELDATLEKVAVFGRVAPEHKLRIVEGFQRRGEVVAMTGDGVNDAPALMKADIGVAMGVTGTEVAKDASAVVITDDNFATIVHAVEEGRVIFNNIRKVVYFLFSTSAAEIVSLTTALMAGLPLPLRAVQILWINLVTSGALTVNLVMEQAEGGEMARPPVKRDAHILSRASLERAFLLVPVMGLGTLGLFAWALHSGYRYEHAQTMGFTVLCAFQWFNGLNARSHLRSIFQVGLFTNKFVLAGLGAAVSLQILAVHASFMQKLFFTVPLSLSEWVLVVAVASTALWADELRKLWFRRKLVAAQRSRQHRRGP